MWYCYPKKTSKKYKTDIKRDEACWQSLGPFNLEGVRQVAIDADWSAVRFRKVEYIKTLKRSARMALSEEAKNRIKENRG